MWSEGDEGTELCRHGLDHLCRIASLIVPGIPDAGVEAHHDRDAAARRLRPDGALRGALSTPRELQMFPRARLGLGLLGLGCALRCLPHCSSSLAPHCSSSLAPTVGPPLPAPHTHTTHPLAPYQAGQHLTPQPP